MKINGQVRDDVDTNTHPRIPEVRARGSRFSSRRHDNEPRFLSSPAERCNARNYIYYRRCYCYLGKKIVGKRVTVHRSVGPFA
jgi:hypothetical protein